MKRVGVIGGGQLAGMMGVAAQKLGVELIVQTPHQDDPAVAVAHDTVLADLNDVNATFELAKKSDVITFENEFVDLESLSYLAKQGVCFRPSLEALSPLLDKFQQRCYLHSLGLPVPKFIALEKKIDHTTELGFPTVLKARRHGYDGQGTFIVKDINTLQQKLESKNIKDLLNKQYFLLEEFIPFTKELAIIAARSVNGEIALYPVVETQQEEQVCRRVIVPADICPEVDETVKDIARTLLSNLQVVGVFGIELFLTDDNQVIINEIAPRTHNSGHFSLDACSTSQFEQHLRAVCGRSLGDTALICPSAVMINLLGYENSHNDYILQQQQLEKIPQAHVHWYGKTESRVGRKMGHVTVLLNDNRREQAMAIAAKVEDIWYPN